jgi:hypothetical protein
MLPKDVLMDTSSRKEAWTPILFKRVLYIIMTYYWYKLFYVISCQFETFKKNLILSRHVLQLCPAFSSSIIKNILDVFVPDEFCPDPIQGSLLQALELEVSLLNSSYTKCTQSLRS